MDRYIVTSALLSLFFLLSLPALAQEPAIAVGEPHPAVSAEPDPTLLRYLGITGNGAGRWSADGQRIAFSTSWTGTSQKWDMPASGGFPTRITYSADAIDFCDYSPHDPNLMWMGVASGGNEKTQLWLTSPDGTLMQELAVNTDVIHRQGDWSRDGRFISYANNARDEQFFDAYIYDFESDEHRMVFSRDGSVGAGEFSPDGEYLLCGLFHSNVNNDVFLVDRDGGRETLLTFHEEEAEFSGFNWAGNRTLYFTTNQGREFHGIARMELPANLDSLQGQDLSELMPAWEYVYEPGRDVSTVEISNNGRIIGWVENEDGFGVAHLATLPDFKPLTRADGTPLPKPEIPGGLQFIGRFSPDDRYVTMQAIGPQGPSDLWRYDLSSGETLRLTEASMGGIPSDSFVEPQVLRFKSFDGLEISGIWYEPKGEKPAGGWPVIIEAHGGPEGQSRPYFDPQKQLYLSYGVAIFALNPRGSSGYGKTFMTLDNAGLREDSVQDYAFARDWLVSQGHADAERVAISGGSYGGYVVLGALTLYPDKWAAGVDVVGISNFVTFLENTGAYRRSIREAEYGFLATDMEMLKRISPIHRVDQIKAPLLIIHGTNDPRVPVGEAQQMHDALAARGQEVDLLVFTDEGHGIAKLENRVIAWQRELAFLREHLGF